MSKDIKDYLHYYLGCEVESNYVRKRKLVGFIYRNNESWPMIQDLGEAGNPIGMPYSVAHNDVKLLLRPLSDMTEDEAKVCYKINPYSKGEWLIKSVLVKENTKGYQPNIVQINWEGKEGSTGYACGTDYMYFNKLSAEQFSYLLSNHFDLFGFIESGLAIDKTKRGI